MVVLLLELVAALRNETLFEFSTAHTSTVAETDNLQFNWCDNLHPGQLTFIGKVT